VRATRAGRRVALLLVLLVAALPACAVEDGELVSPGCSLSDDLYTLVLTAETVRTATRVPCLRALQPGWELELYDARNDRARIVLGSDRGGDGAVTIDLVPRCDLRRSTEVPSDELGAERYEEVVRLPPRYQGTRSYVFPGGCVRFGFDIDARFASGLVNETSLMVGFVPRRAVREALTRKTRNDVEHGL
jgi:hypothetical protein